jgi:NAD+ kinase
MSKRIGLVIRPGNQKILNRAKELLAWCEERSIAVEPESQTAQLLEMGVKGLTPTDLAQRVSTIVTLGGDGTLIGVARYVKGTSPLFVGVNFGNLGFLTEVSPEELSDVLERALASNVSSAERTLLQVRVEREGAVFFESQAVNDVVVQKGATSPLPDLDLSVNGNAVARIRADGIIFATPTGSTAYSLAAGGSIAHPSVSVILVTPVCPHSLTNRPLILPGSAQISVELPKFHEEVLVTVDGQVSKALRPGDVIRVGQAKQTVRFVISEDKSYFDILRTKLNWGVPNQPD